MLGELQGREPPPEPAEPPPVDPIPSPDVVVLPPPVPVPVHPPPNEARGRGRGRGRGGRGERHHYEPFEVQNAAGEPIGHILMNETGSSLDIHCWKHKECSIGRTWAGWDETKGALTPLRAGKGRPLGFLVAWLRYGERFEATDAGRAAHMDAKFGKGAAACLNDGTGVARMQARAYVDSVPSLKPCRDRERPPRPGEPREPLGPFSGR